MNCRDLMTSNPDCCVPTDTVTRAAEMMRNDDVGAVPIVAGKDDKRLIGMVTDRDLAIKVLTQGRDANSIRVDEIMSRDLVTCHPDEDVRRALLSMSKRQVRRIPVVDSAGKLIGIIAQADVARKMDEDEIGEVVGDISEPRGFTMGRALHKTMTSSGLGQRRQSGGLGALIGGASVGAIAMYLLDPNRGRHRRALVRDKVVSWYNDVTCFTKKAQRDASNRMSGIVAETKGRMQHESIPDDKLVSRIRSKMGRVASHPHSIQVDVSGGHVTLRGPILESEADHLISYVSHLSGVVSVDDQLERKETADGTPGLQGQSRRPGDQMDVLQKNWAPATRVAASAIGGGLVLYGLTAPSRWSKASAALGLGLLTRGITNKEIMSWAELGDRPRPGA